MFWKNRSLDLHNIVEFPVNCDKLLHIGNDRVFNFIESLYPLNVRKEAENGVLSAFQFWKLPKVWMRLNEILVEFYLNTKILTENRNPLLRQLVFDLLH